MRHHRAGAARFISQTVRATHIFLQFQVLRSVRNGLHHCFGICYEWIKTYRSGQLAPVYLRAVMLTICMFLLFGAPVLSVANGRRSLHLSIICIVISRTNFRRNGRAVATKRLGLGASGGFLMLDPLGETFTAAQILPIVAGFFTLATF